MGECADVKRKKMLHALKKLLEIHGFDVNTGGNHQWIVKHTTWLRPFPIPFKHNKIKKAYVQALIKLIANTGDCSEEIFKEWLR